MIKRQEQKGNINMYYGIFRNSFSVEIARYLLLEVFLDVTVAHYHDVFSSTTHLRQLTETEAELVRGVEAYLAYEQSKLSVIRK